MSPSNIFITGITKYETPNTIHSVSIPKSVTKLAKFLHYILGCRPDEFGLVPDPQGFVPEKDLLKALAEESGWKHVRHAHLHEIALTVPSAPIEFREKNIRAKMRDHLPRPVHPENPPKILYTCIRKRAHPVVMQKGLVPTRNDYVILSDEPRMAERIGKRLDPSPVLINVNVSQSMAMGVEYQRFGDNLFLASPIPPECISGPPLPKETAETKKPAAAPKVPKHAGSFFPDADRLAVSGRSNKIRKKGKDKSIQWKKHRKQIRRQKERGWKESS